MLMNKRRPLFFQRGRACRTGVARHRHRPLPLSPSVSALCRRKFDNIRPFPHSRHTHCSFRPAQLQLTESQKNEKKKKRSVEWKWNDKMYFFCIFFGFWVLAGFVFVLNFVLCAAAATLRGPTWRVFFFIILFFFRIFENFYNSFLFSRSVCAFC